MTRATTTTHYEWRVPSRDKEFLVVPHADTMKYEFPIDFMFDSPEEAETFLVDWGLTDEAREDEWVLVHITQTEVAR